jgi:hypothetical protein
MFCVRKKRIKDPREVSNTKAFLVEEEWVRSTECKRLPGKILSTVQIVRGNKSDYSEVLNGEKFVMNVCTSSQKCNASNFTFA